MRDWVVCGRSLLGVAALCVGVAGCAGQRDESLRLTEELGRARADAAWQAARAAEFEARMSRLEQRAAVATSNQRAEDRELLSRLDRLIELNAQLIAERGAAAPAASSGAAAPAASSGAAAPAASSGAANGKAVPGALPPPATGSVTSHEPTLSDEQALRALVERLRGRPGSPHGGLTREQEGALRVLMRPERQLDTENPWPAAFY